MQEILNKMVSTVRHGILGPDLASQTIHECAAMLGLQLASELDEASLIVTGMRKTVTKIDLIAGFIEFGTSSGFRATAASKERMDKGHPFRVRVRVSQAGSCRTRRQSPSDSSPRRSAMDEVSTEPTSRPKA